MQISNLSVFPVRTIGVFSGSTAEDILCVKSGMMFQAFPSIESQVGIGYEKKMLRPLLLIAPVLEINYQHINKCANQLSEVVGPII